MIECPELCRKRKKREKRRINWVLFMQTREKSLMIVTGISTLRAHFLSFDRRT